MNFKIFIVLCLWCMPIHSTYADEKTKIITFAVGHDHKQMLSSNYPIYRASWQFISQSLMQMGYDVKTVIRPWARANYYVKTGKADGLFLAANLPGRDRWAILSNPLGYGAFGGFYHKDRKAHKTIIASVRLGVQDKILSRYHVDEMLEVATAQQGFKLLYNQKVDRFVMSESYGQYLLNTELEHYADAILFDHSLIEKRSIHIAFAKDLKNSRDVLHVVNKAIEQGIKKGWYLEAMTNNKVPKHMQLPNDIGL